MAQSLIFMLTDQSSIWCSILREVKSLKDSGFDFSSHCKKRHGRIWVECVVADGTGEVWMEEKWWWRGGRVSCKGGMTLNDGREVKGTVVTALCVQFPSFVCSRVGIRRLCCVMDLSSICTRLSFRLPKDRWTCDLSGDGEFKVKVIRNFIDDLFLPSSDVETRWVKFIPIKVNVFSWRARRDRLPTRVNLCRSGVLWILICVLFVMMLWRSSACFLSM
ncbi:hypothetical protein Tco_0123054 [Tanacetum coccineum]